MAIRQLKPVTPASRFTSRPDFSEITTDKPEKSLVRKLKKSGGRNNRGRITSRRRGGGHKRSYRIIDFKRNKFEAKIARSIFGYSILYLFLVFVLFLIDKIIWSHQIKKQRKKIY